MSSFSSLTKHNWKAILGWSEEHLEDLRFAGFSFLRQGQYNKAILFFEALIILNPTGVYDLQTLGALYLERGENQKAIDFLNKALRLEEGHEPSLLNQVKALFSLGKKQKASAIAFNLLQSADPYIKHNAEALLMAYGFSIASSS
ncbi:Uncharacterized protein CLAVI_000509 [Candidatus Clavichlamydia salmonicola]|uniref:CDC27 family protein n=1 Tax=Candidatus Clavichlamydia salmonicola TaxID=469812 RepID=UPI0018910B33|nr:CDC27 family protein [Candidatus Clavichlamydia salmonicola]MBF5050887.1 Uncharacterized protein [Candidatus Clavichlamydia salmonicola]